MAAVWRLPLVLVVENNRYAFSTPTRLQYACRQLADRGPGYGVASVTVDGNDPDAMAAVYAEAFARARAGEGPTLVEAMLGRMRGHAEGDGSLKVVPDEELQGYLAADPVPAYARRLEREGVLLPEQREAIDRRCAELVETSLERALAAAPPQAEVAWRPVFAAVTDEDLQGRAPSAGAVQGGGRGARPTGSSADAARTAAPMRGRDGGTRDHSHGRLRPRRRARRPREQERRAASSRPTSTPSTRRCARRWSATRRVVLMGQDIGAFEGAFRVTRGLFARWPDRVLDTPIAEAGTVGIAAGAALLGYRPIVEMQFADFVSNAFNQLVNVAAKLYYRFGVPCPLVVRLPSGGGVGAGPFHSQNPEGWFAHAGGLKVVCPATARDALALMKAAIRDPNPVIFCEHKFLYRRIKEMLAASEPLEPLGRARVAREGRDLTLVGYGATTWTCLEAAEALEKDGVAVEVVDLRTLVPYDEATVLASVKKTSRAVVVHEDLLTAGFGAEVAAQLADAAFPWLDAPVKRVAYPDRPSPYAKVLEQQLLPGVEKVLAAARETLAY